MKNRYFAALALAGLVSFAACGGGEEAAVEETIVEDTASMAAPVTPAPVVTDTAAGMAGDTGAAAGAAGDTAAQ